jgi:hypothetical protein
MSTPAPIAVKVSDGWKPAFWDHWYREYVIEVCWCRSTKEEIEEDIREGRVYANMPCKYEGK